MTVSSQELFQSTTKSLVGYGNFYPTQVAVHHHQLRHLVTVTQGDRIYYVNNYDVFVLDLHTNKSTLLATIPFEARCLAAGHGWVCVGGEQNGDCAFIRLNTAVDSPKCFDHDLNVDVLGGDIVNAMNVHLLREDPDCDPEPVVLISNNDRTVKLFSLARREVLTTLTHDKPMNYATLSPDSTLLAAVGDSDKVYFYKRRKIEPIQTKQAPTWSFPNFDWRPLAMPTVPIGNNALDDHSFAIAFSPAGNLCAASSQGGTITVFDVDSLHSIDEAPEAAIICSFKSSRSTLCGCVRSMAFSPQPWDLLAWAEDHGRIGIADVRQMFVRRQIMKLDREQSALVLVDDTTPEMYKDLSVMDKLKQQHLARLRTMRGSSAEAMETERLLSDSRTEVAPRRYRRQDLMTYHRNLDLDARERSVVEALDSTMSDVEHQMRPYSVSYTVPPRFRPSHLADPSTAEVDSRLITSLEGRQGYRPYQPRRRSSVVLSASPRRQLALPDSPRARISASPGRITDDDDTPPMSTNDLTPSRGGVTSQPRTSDIPTSDPWHVIQSALESARRTDEGNPTQFNLQQIEAALEAERRLGMQLDRQLADERQLSIHLRRQLDSHRQLLQAQRNELTAINDAASRLQPSIDELLQRELTSERRFGDTRAAELEEEIRAGGVRARGLEDMRARMLRIESQALDRSSTSSAQSSALPTTSTSTSTRSVSSADTSVDLASVTVNEAVRRQRLAHIENLERQVRRAEARVRLAGSDLHSLERSSTGNVQSGVETPSIEPLMPIDNEFLTGPGGTPRTPTMEELRGARELNMSIPTYYQYLSNQPNPSTNRPTSSSDRSSFPAGVAATRAATMERLRAWRPTQPGITRDPTSVSLSREIVNRPSRTTSELAGGVTEREMRLARMMFLQGNARSTDGNGNWVTTGLQRIAASAGSAFGGSTENAGSGQRPATTMSAEQVLNDVGIGTAGIGWSEDGSRL